MLKRMFLGLFILFMGLEAQGIGITLDREPEPVVYPEGPSKRATLIKPEQLPPITPVETTPVVPEVLGWELIDSLKLERLLLAGERCCIYFDAQTKSLKDTLVPAEFISELCQRAVAKAPNWLKWDLADNLRRLANTYSIGMAETYAKLILETPDPKYLDEVCFQVAHLAPQTLHTGVFDPQIIIVNTRLAYQIDKDLKYVDIVDYGDPALGGDYYSTTRYRTLKGRDTVVMEIPKEIYYWWVIMPRVAQERPRMDATVYNKFWREFLYYHADPGYPLLKEVLAPVKVLWDGKNHVLEFKREFTEKDFALDVVGNWTAKTVPMGRTGPSHIQPNQIARVHNGNCGELAVLLCAAARTALIPCVNTLNINEDHVWDEFWWDGKWYPYQVDLGSGPTRIAEPHVALDRDVIGPGGKNCSCIWNWRADGYQWSTIERYSKFCTLTVQVFDREGNPIDGANVNIDKGLPGFAGATGFDGRFTTLLGDHCSYRVTIKFGPITRSLGTVISAEEAVPGAHFFIADTLDTLMRPVVEPVPKTTGITSDYMVRVVMNLPYEVVYGWDYGLYQMYFHPPANYALKCEPGRINFFIAEGEQFSKYLRNRPFQAFLPMTVVSRLDTSFILPYEYRNYYLVFSNERPATLSRMVEATAYLYKERMVEVAEPSVPSPALFTLRCEPNPCKGSACINFQLPSGGPVSLRIYDALGRVVKDFTETMGLMPGGYSVVWDGRDGEGRRVAPGVYFCRLQVGPEILTQKVVLTR